LSRLISTPDYPFQDPLILSLHVGGEPESQC
jgi:hypothetical protein